MTRQSFVLMHFSERDREEFREFFGAYPEQLDDETFKKTLRDLRAKYHPDNFTKFDDETVLRLATDWFQRIEALAQKKEGRTDVPAPAGHSQDLVDAPDARFAYQALKIELRTADKDLKYRLFGTFYRWLSLGEKFRVPGTKAFIVADEAHAGRGIGFVEGIRLYLTFEEDDSVEEIVNWFYERIAGWVESVMIEGQIVEVSYEALLREVKRRSLKRLGDARAVSV